MNESVESDALVMPSRMRLAPARALPAASLCANMAETPPVVLIKQQDRA